MSVYTKNNNNEEAVRVTGEVDIGPVELSVDEVGIKDTTDTQIDPATKQKQDEQLTALASILAAILPDGHNVNVANEVEVTLNGEAIALDAATIAALQTITVNQGTSPWVVSGTVTSTPSGTQDVNIVSAVELEVTLNGEQVDIGNFPTEYPLPAAQVTTLTPQTDALTNAQLRASDVEVNDDVLQGKIDTLNATDFAISANQLPDGHNVTANKGAGWVDPQTDALTDAQLRATAVKVDDDQTQSALATIAGNQLPDNHQVTVSNQITGFATAAKQQTDALTEAELRTVIPDTQGAWGYDAGTSGTLNVAANKRVMQITATAGILGATMTINGGSTITIPAGRSLTIEPRANLIAPTIVFTNTTAYFVECVE